MRTELGKISRAEFGLGGYQGCQVGLWLTLSAPGVGVQTSYTGGWDFPPGPGASWTLEGQTATYGEMVRKVVKLLHDAKVTSVAALVGVPVELTIDGTRLESFRVLKEVL